MAQDIAEYAKLLHDQRDAMLETVKDLPDAAVDWTPMPQDTSSLSMMALHGTGHLRRFLVENVTGREIEYDRAAAFASKGMGAAKLAETIRATYDMAEKALQSVDPETLDRPKLYTINHPIKGTTATPGYGIHFSMGHVWMHIGHMQLTRQLWAAQAGQSK